MELINLHPQNDDLDKKDLQFRQWIKEMPDLEPPEILLTSVMEALRPKRSSWHRRLLLWAQTPKMIHLTPLKVAPIAAILSVAILLPTLLLLKQEKPVFTKGLEKTSIPVVFSLNLSEAQSVSVIGTFNGWNPRGYEMKLDRELRWWSLSASLPEGRYEYMFLVNGQKMILDPGAFIHQEDGFGNQNSVLVLKRKNGEPI
jgi:hypothetical protein